MQLKLSLSLDLVYRAVNHRYQLVSLSSTALSSSHNSNEICRLRWPCWLSKINIITIGHFKPINNTYRTRNARVIDEIGVNTKQTKKLCSKAVNIQLESSAMHILRDIQSSNWTFTTWMQNMHVFECGNLSTHIWNKNALYVRFRLEFYEIYVSVDNCPLKIPNTVSSQ